MKQCVYKYQNHLDLIEYLNSDTSIIEARSTALSTLIQINSETKITEVNEITSELCIAFPEAVIIGASSAGGVINESVVTDSVVISFSFFYDTQIMPFSLACSPGKEFDTGVSLGRIIGSVPDVKGILLLTTPLTINTPQLLKGVMRNLSNHLIFGGGASENKKEMKSWVLHHKQVFKNGVVAVAFSSKSLEIQANIGSGWRSFGISKTITDTDGHKVVTIDHKPAADIFQQYESSFTNNLFSEQSSVLSLMFERNNQMICRTPLFRDKFGTIHFSADVYKNETFKFGLGDPARMHSLVQEIANKQREFQPEGLFVFACSIRKILLQDDAEIETKIISDISSSGGFYTSLEILNVPESPGLTAQYNTCMLIIGFRENHKEKSNGYLLEQRISNNVQIGQTPGHTKVIANLLQFIRIITKELEDINRELLSLSITDKLTGIYNRSELDNVLTKEIERAQRYGISLSVIIVDIDNFKLINDTFGHLNGDKVLIETARILKSCIRINDTLGRWGGEEFLIILPHTNAKSATIVAEKMRKALEAQEWDVVGQQTASFGIASCAANDCIAAIIDKADTALYEAKKNGKNQIVLAEQDRTLDDTHGFLKLNWKPEYECHNELIDTQHQNLFTSGNTIIQALLEHQSESQIQLLVDKLIHDLTVHFEAEEKIFEKTDYPYKDGHRANHQDLLIKAQQLNALFKQNRLSAGELLGFIVHDTISEHLLKSDRGFFKYIHKMN